MPRDLERARGCVLSSHVFAMRRSWIIALCGVAACRESVLSVPADETIDYLALIELDGARNLAASTPLIRRRDGEPFELRGRDDETLAIAGFSEARLEPVLRGVDRSTIETTPLSPVFACEQRLPRPELYLQVNPGEAEMVDPASAPLLGASWLQSTCPRVDRSRIAVDARCQAAVCLRGATQGSGCNLELDLSTCFAEPLPVVELAKDRLCIPSSESWSCTEIETLLGAAASAECRTRLFEGSMTNCRLDLYLDPEAPRFSIDARVSLVDSAMGRSVLQLGSDSILEAAAFDMIIAGGRIYASAALDGQARVRCGDGVSAPPTLLHAIDPQTLSPLWSRPAPPCLSFLIPFEGGFAGLFPEPARGAWAIARFDASGTLTSTAPLSPSHLQIGRDRLRALLPAEDGAQLFFASFDAGQWRSRLLALDARSLELEQELAFPGRVRAIDGAGAKKLVAVADEEVNGWLHRIDLQGGSVEQTRFWPSGLVSIHSFINDVRHDPTSGSDVFLVGRDLEEAYVWSEDRYERVSFYQRRIQPGRMTELPGAGGLFVVSGVTPEDEGASESVLFVLDAVHRRILPGITALGVDVGPAVQLRTDEEGRVFILLGWTGELIRASSGAPP